MAQDELRFEALEPKLDSLARCLGRIESKKPFTREELESDFDLQDIVTVNLERAVQLCVDIASMIISYSEFPAPTQMAETFDVLTNMGWILPATAQKMKKAVGFRNIAVHEYEKINWSIVHQVATHSLQDFKDFAAQVIARAKGVRRT